MAVTEKGLKQVACVALALIIAGLAYAWHDTVRALTTMIPYENMETAIVTNTHLYEPGYCIWFPGSGGNIVSCYIQILTEGPVGQSLFFVWLGILLAYGFALRAKNKLTLPIFGICLALLLPLFFWYVSESNSYVYLNPRPYHPLVHIGPESNNFPLESPLLYSPPIYDIRLTVALLLCMEICGFVLGYRYATTCKSLTSSRFISLWGCTR